MLEQATATHPAGVISAAAIENEANVWQVALLLVAQHGADAAEAARNHEQAAAAGETPERDIWQWVLVAVEYLLGELSSADLLYATVLVPPPAAEISAQAA